MHVFYPDGEHVKYNSKYGPAGGFLDRDDTDGYGPEIFTLVKPPSGIYQFHVDAYRIDGRPTTSSLKVQLGNKLVFDGNYRFTNDDGNTGNGQSGSAEAFWPAFDLLVAELSITDVGFETDSQPDQAIFTTTDGENKIQVTLEAPDEITDEMTGLDITRTGTDAPSSIGGASDRVITFALEHTPPEDLKIPGKPLSFDLIAFGKFKEQRLESEPVRITQDTRSQIRQEYIDKRAKHSKFIHATPKYDDIIKETGFSAEKSPNFTSREFFKLNDFSPEFTIIEKSQSIAQTLRTAWGHPLRITSAYRNPRRNDRLSASVLNSYHQTGNAVDLNPFKNAPKKWPASVNCLDEDGKPETMTIDHDDLEKGYAEAQLALECLAKETFGEGYHVLFHADHVHISYKGTEQEKKEQEEQQEQ